MATQTTRELWASEGPFQPYEVQRSRANNVPHEYIKAAVWDTIEGDLGYHARSRHTDEDDNQYPVEFHPERVCWVEIRWIENLEIGGHWEAFRIAGTDLGLDITQEDVERHQRTAQTVNVPTGRHTRRRNTV